MNELKVLKSKKFHFIGIGGASMSSLAVMLKKSGFYVQGSDEVNNDEVRALRKYKIKVCLGHSKTNVYGMDVVVYSSAILEDNPELVYARKSNFIIIKRAELLGLIAEGYKTVIAVAGSHGKTTTSAMIGEMLENSWLKPTLHIGGKLKSIGSNFKVGNKKYFVTENCEYKDNFLYVKPDISVILNIDKDHLDYFGSLENIKNSFLKYAKGTKEGGVNIVCDQDLNSKELLKLKNTASFGLDSKSDVYARNIKEYKAGFFSFDVIFSRCKLGDIKLGIIGEHNILNALACVLVGLICGLEFEPIKHSIEKFSGVERRSEFLGELLGAKVYHDYAHHPNQIENMIRVANMLKEKGSKLIVVFEPHTYSRTKFLLAEFAKSFIGADQVFLAKVYSAREKEEDGLNTKDLFLETQKFIKKVNMFNSYEEIVNSINLESKRGDVILILGAGSIVSLKNMLNLKK